MDRTILGDGGRLKEVERKEKKSSRGLSERAKISNSLMNHG